MDTTDKGHSGTPAETPPPHFAFSAASREEMARIVGALYHVHELISAIPDLDVLLEKITDESKIVAQAEASSLMLYDPATEELFFHVALGESGDQERLKREIRLRLGQGIAGVAAQTRKSVMVNDAQEDPRFCRDVDCAIRFTTRNLLAVPMVDRDRLVGVLEVVNKVGGAFTQLDLTALEMFSSHAATSITNARLIEDQIRNAQLAAVGQAVAGLSHHAKNIVTGLLSSADLIELGLASGKLDALTRAWPVFRRSTQRISNFVQDMLSYSKPRKPMRARVEPESLLEEVRETFSELFLQKNVQVDMDASHMQTPLFADSPALYRMLLNLVINAAEVAPETGGHISVVLRPLGEDAVEILVSDNGPGIPENDRQRVFDPFFSTKGSKGTGLGLAVSHKVVTEHGGAITVEDAPEGGALFRIVLPNCQYWTEDGLLG